MKIKSGLSESWPRLSHSNFCVLVTAITNEKDNCKFMLDAAIRVCSLSAELIKLVGKRLATSSDFTFRN